VKTNNVRWEQTTQVGSKRAVTQGRSEHNKQKRQNNKQTQHIRATKN
jgi:hypothetical protein